MRKIGKALRFTAYGVALYVLLSQAAQSGLYALCFNNVAKTQGVLRDVLQWLMSIDATTMRIMMVVIIISAAADFGHVIQFLFDVAIGFGTMTLWRLLNLEVPTVWSLLASDAVVTIFVVSLFASLFDIHVVKRQPKGKQPKSSNQRSPERTGRTQGQVRQQQAQQTRVVQVGDQVVQAPRTMARRGSGRNRVNWEGLAQEMEYESPDNYQPKFTHPS